MIKLNDVLVLSRCHKNKLSELNSSQKINIIIMENLFVAANIKDKKRQRALLLYYAGEEDCEIFETIPESGDDFDKVKGKLDEYFDPEKNIESEIYMFWQAKQNSGESMNSYHSRLRQLASTILAKSLGTLSQKHRKFAHPPCTPNAMLI